MDRRLTESIWCTGKDSNLRTSLGGTDLQSVGFNHSPTCAKPPSFRFPPQASVSDSPQRESHTRSKSAGFATTQKNRSRANTLAHGNHYTSEKFLNGVRLENLLRR